MNNPLLAIQSQYWAVRDYLSPVLKESKFKEHGRITPEEFVAAGDFLTFKFPVWQWEKGEPSRARDFLPPDKQYLVTRNVPCLRRATAVDYTNADEDAEKLLSFLDDAEEAPGPDDDWVATHINRSPPHRPADMDEIPDIPDSPTTAPTREMAGLNVSSGGKLEEDEIPDIDDIPDMDEEGLEDLEDDAAVRIVHPSEAEVNSTAGKNLLQVRTYDCIISYDKHYQTPRFWLFGYDEHKNPLTPAQVFQDVPADHAFKTMTMESFPHSGAQLASVHPCKHASVMKKFIDRMEAAQGPALTTEPEAISSTSVAGGSAGGKEEKEKKKKWGLGGMVRKVTGGSVPKVEKEKDEVVTGVPVDFYLVIFLKFIASIVPTIEVDSTTSTAL
ncbi:preconditioning-inducible protein [Cryptococcus gattii Ru294]|uniref:Autophagy-related protein 3 n=2 Tax=Cryptococcus gattii TaxID=37769 RepID=E6RDY8_CRYGW|nr:Autophagy-related protein, putative [Cryptococcus gattii WM276]KIR51097.1 preconditioning-inducible protein [Cryptococcus gattii Ru294]KIR79030.1 preconditioning-inducible protein [Cryptococcus gattii EJB2]KIY30830.1 preconditioning-inducible protein [Cryptococcus gattii E566]KJE01711.1 preconditioning-inducible protein [Cryptococcus gattii NT-10]ADV25031.1 Autophagy-related protein, putative [Cryptococcus gattii WM276]